MRAKYTGKIVSLEKENGDTDMVIEAKGKVDTRNIASQPTEMHVTLTIKSAIADQMKIGATITVTVSDEETNEGST